MTKMNRHMTLTYSFTYGCGHELVDVVFFFFQAEDGIRDYKVTGVQTCALPISMAWSKVALPLRAGEQATSVARLDLGVYVTTAGASLGGIYTMQLGQSGFSRDRKSVV